jgi:small subunit ribosomal protein S9
MDLKTELVFKKENIGLGRRKQASARVFLREGGKGELRINKISGNKYLQYNESYLKLIWLPLKELKLHTMFDIEVIVQGGGLTGQAEAIQLGVARLICKQDNSHRLVLKPLGLLTRDSRIKERKKYGLRKARKAPQYSKR